MSVNKVILVGNVGADPEIRTSKSGSKVASIRLATTERRKGQDGTWADHTEWHRLTVFGKTAETVEAYVEKGKQLYIEGKLSTTSYEKDGQKRYSTDIIVDVLQMLGKKGAGDGSETGRGRTMPEIPNGASGDLSKHKTSSIDDSDIPF